MFGNHGLPKKLESDNGPIFNSKKFAEFADEVGFEHNRVTPLHVRAKVRRKDLFSY